MAREHDSQRRALIAAMSALPLSRVGNAVAADRQAAGAHTLVAFFSRSGNTRVVAGLIQRALNADVFEIRPATSYPEDYLATVAQAKRETDRNFEPALAARVARIASYEQIFLGFPIWGTTTPPIIRSFLHAHDLTGKTVIPFVTHGGYGLGNSLSVLASHAAGARLLRGFVMQADQERSTMERVNAWMTDAGIHA